MQGKDCRIALTAQTGVSLKLLQQTRMNSLASRHPTSPSVRVCITGKTFCTFHNSKPWFTARLRELCRVKKDAYRGEGGLCTSTPEMWWTGRSGLKETSAHPCSGEQSPGQWPEHLWKLEKDSTFLTPPRPSVTNITSSTSPVPRPCQLDPIHRKGKGYGLTFPKAEHPESTRSWQHPSVWVPALYGSNLLPHL